MRWKLSFGNHLHNGCSKYIVRLDVNVKGKLVKYEYREKCILALGSRKQLYY